MKVVSQYIGYWRSFNGDFPMDLGLRNIFGCLDLFIQKNQSFFFVDYYQRGVQTKSALCGLSIVGTDSLGSVNHIKRARQFIKLQSVSCSHYYHQPTRKVVAKALYFNKSNDDCAGPRFPFFTTILAKIYETNFSVGVKQRTMGKVQFLIFSSLLLVSTKFSIWEKD